MLTKEQKKQHIELGADLTKKSKALIFADFSGISTSELNKLKTELKKAGAKFKVLKKRLLKLALKEAGIEYDPTQFEAQVGVVFAQDEMPSVAGTVYKFSKDLAKENKDFKILGAYDLAEGGALDADQFIVIAKLPTREVLLAQLVGVLSGPIRAFMYLADQLSKRVPAEEPKKEEVKPEAPTSAEGGGGVPTGNVGESKVEENK